MSEERQPRSDTEAWFKELENRLDRVRALLGDAEIQAARAMRASEGIHTQLSIVQELFAKIDDRLATLLANATGDDRRPRHHEASQDAVVYREVPGFPGYRAGSDGTVWGSRRAGRGYGRSREWRPLKPYLVRPGPALTVSLYRDRVRHSMRVDAVILLAFVGEQPEGWEVESRNGDRLDNRLDNLRYIPSRRSA
jgi:HNH endonuclease